MFEKKPKKNALSLTPSCPTYKGSREGKTLSIGVVASRYNPQIIKGLIEGCFKGLQACHVLQKNTVFVWVPGAFEIPLAVKQLTKHRHVDAVVCLGAVIRGETAHFDHVAQQAARGILDLNLELDIPVVFGVLTTDTLFQAQERSQDDEHNKGFEAALTAVEMATIFRET